MGADVEGGGWGEGRLVSVGEEGGEGGVVWGGGREIGKGWEMGFEG